MTCPAQTSILIDLVTHFFLPTMSLSESGDRRRKSELFPRFSIFSSRVLSGRLPTLPLLISSLILHDTSSESLPNPHFQENSPLIPSHNIFCFSFTAIIKMCHHLLISTTICLMRRCWVCSSLQTQRLSSWLVQSKARKYFLNEFKASFTKYPYS